MQTSLKDIKNKIDLFGNNLSKLEGELDTLNKQQNESKNVIEENESNKLLFSQAVELLTLVQEQTRDKIKSEFEQLITFILQYVTEKDYRFVVVFSKRGSLGEVDFEILPPNADEPMDLLDQTGGGICDLVSFGLRILLMECSIPKVNGFFLGDEAFKHLDSDYQEKVPFLLEELNKRLNRQIILISHEAVIKTHSSFNKIEIK